MSGISIIPKPTGFMRRGSAPKVSLKVYEDGGARYGGTIIVTAEGVHLSFQNGADLSFPDFAILNQRITEAQQNIQNELARRSETIA